MLHSDFIQGAQYNVLRQSCKNDDLRFRYHIIAIEMGQIKTQLTSEHANGAAQQSGTEAAVSEPPQTHTHLSLQRLAPDKQDKARLPTALMLICLLFPNTSHTHNTTYTCNC